MTIKQIELDTSDWVITAVSKDYTDGGLITRYSIAAMTTEGILDIEIDVVDDAEINLPYHDEK